MSDITDKIKKLHGPEYSEGPWTSMEFECCILCKTKNPEDRHKHWSHGLCRSCYRRLSATHRMYNDKWNDENSRSLEIGKHNIHKKDYKSVDPTEISFNQEDVISLLERYDFKCAYCLTELQTHDHKALNALHVEYRSNNNEFELVASCKSCNCSKKSIIDELKLKRWAKERGLRYPIIYKPYKT